MELTIDREWLVLEDVLVGAGGIRVEPARRILKRVIEEELDGLAKLAYLLLIELFHEGSYGLTSG